MPLAKFDPLPLTSPRMKYRSFWTKYQDQVNKTQKNMSGTAAHWP